MGLIDEQQRQVYRMLARKPIHGEPRDRGWVYFIGGGDLVKIGWSRTPEQRLIDLRPCSPVNLWLMAAHRGSMKVELELHRRFAAARRHGEWFARVPELNDHIAAVVAEHGPCPWITPSGTAPHTT